MVSTTLKGCHIAVSGKLNDQYTPDKMRSWIAARGGQLQSNITPETTHLVVTEKHWNDKTSVVQKAIEANSAGQEIKIVTFEWLDDTLQKSSKRSENKYLWEYIERKAKRRSNKAVNGVGAACEEDVSLTSVLEEHTKGFVDEKEFKGAQKKMRAEEEIRRKEKEEMKIQEQETIKQVENPAIAAVFRKNAKRAKNDILSTSHHLYHDHTGFAYDVTLVKADWAHNRNERYALTIQIYESNSEPATYAVNAQYASTGAHAKNDVVGPIGSTFSTAFRVFRSLFKEKTMVDWNSRVEFATELEQRENPKRFEKLGPLPESKFPMELFAPKDFQSAVFQYTPPAYPPRGLPYDDLPSQQRSTILKSSLRAAREEEGSEGDVNNASTTKPDLEPLMSGGNGSEAQDSPQQHCIKDAEKHASTDGLVADKKNSSEDSMEGAFDYPFNEVDGHFAQNAFAEPALLLDTIEAVADGLCFESPTQINMPGGQSVASFDHIVDAQGANQESMLVEEAENVESEIYRGSQNDAIINQEREVDAENVRTGISSIGAVMDLKRKSSWSSQESVAQKKAKTSEDSMSEETIRDLEGVAAVSSAQAQEAAEGEASEVFFNNEWVEFAATFDLDMQNGCN